VYVLVFAITISTLWLSRLFYGENWGSAFSKTGWLLVFASLLPLVFLFKNFALFGAIIAIIGLIGLLLFYSPWKTNAMEKGLVISQGFDGAATFVAVSFGGYSEQHVVGNLIFDYFGGPFAFLVVKLLFALLVVYVLRREKGNEVPFVSLLITLFGLAPGTRDALRLLAGV
ncbi:DUF63 family protein, partial [Candidatus Micrarchaeota archaeon]|nr:DUF63 family protein [Candidatus Micrarchaeota archaeon]